MNANIFSGKIEMSKSEAKAAGKIGSEKYHELRQYMKEFPGFEIHIKAAAKRKVEFRDLNYDYMRAYIKKHDDDDGTIMAEFRTLIAQDKKDKVEGSENLKAANYLDVKKWFLAKFPEVAKFGTIENEDKNQKDEQTEEAKSQNVIPMNPVTQAPEQIGA